MKTRLPRLGGAREEQGSGEGIQHDRCTRISAHAPLASQVSGRRSGLSETSSSSIREGLVTSRVHLEPASEDGSAGEPIKQARPCCWPRPGSSEGAGLCAWPVADLRAAAGPGRAPLRGPSSVRVCVCQPAMHSGAAQAGGEPLPGRSRVHAKACWGPRWAALCSRRSPEPPRRTMCQSSGAPCALTRPGRLGSRPGARCACSHPEPLAMPRRALSSARRPCGTGWSAKHRRLCAGRVSLGKARGAARSSSLTALACCAGC